MLPVIFQRLQPIPEVSDRFVSPTVSFGTFTYLRHTNHPPCSAETVHSKSSALSPVAHLARA